MDWREALLLRGAVVSEKGVVAGFAHTNTVTGPEVFGSLEIVVLDANGDLRSRWTTPREYSRFPDGPENPTGRAVTLARDPERIIVRVSENDLENPRERLWIYQLDGKGEVVKLRFESAFLKSDGTGDLVAAHGVKGTPLLLCHWETDWYLAYHGVPIGSRFQLYHPSGALVWSLNVAGPAYQGNSILGPRAK